MFRRGSNFVQDILAKPRWIDAFKVGEIVSPVITDDHYFTGKIVEIDPKINKIFVSWEGGSQPTQHDPDELEPLYQCIAPPAPSEIKTASVRTAYSGLIAEAIKICKEHGINIGKPGYGTFRNECIIKDEDQKEARRILKENGIIAEFSPGVGHDYNYGGDLFRLKRDDSEIKTASVRTASMSDYDYQCCTAIRNAIIEEHAAVALYEEMAQFAQDDNFKTVAQSIAEEEKAHIGELTDLLDRYNGNEVANMNDGIAEVAEMLAPEPSIVLEEDVVEAPKTNIVDAIVSEISDPATAISTVPENVEIVGVVDDTPPMAIPLLASAKKRKEIIASGSYSNTAFPDLVRCIRESWEKIPPKANVFLEIMEGMGRPTDRTGQYDGVDVIESFIENAAGWNTSTGKAIKKELGKRIKNIEKKDYVLDVDKKKEGK